MRNFIFIAGLISIFSCIAHAQSKSGIKTLNGTRIFLTQNGEGESLVVLHGGPGLNHLYFKPHLEILEKNFQVIYYDQRASGKSATPSSTDSINMNFLVNDLEAIRKEYRIDKMNVLAHSWGAVLAVHYALAYPDHIKKLILSNPAMLSREFDQEATKLAKAKTTDEDSVRRAELMATGMRDVQNYEDFFLLSFKASAHDPKNLTKINLGLPVNFPEASRALFSGLMKDPATQRDLYFDLPRLRMPVLVIHGEADIIPPASLEKLRQNIPNVSYESFPKSGHFPFVEETERFNDVVKKFLSGEKEKKKKASR